MTRSSRLRRLVPRTLLLAAAVALGGCSLWRMARYREPVVRVEEIRVAGLGLDGGELDVVLSVYNPNGFALDATRLTYQVDVDSIEVGRGALSEQFVVGERDSALVRVPVRFTYRGLGAAGLQLIRSGRVEYRVHGDLGVRTPLGAFSRGYDRTGRFAP